MLKTDSELMESINSPGERDAALAQVYKDCWPIVKHLGLKNQFTNDDCKDVLQEAVIILWQNIFNGAFVLKSKISTYVIQICKFKFMNRIRNEASFKMVDFEIDKVELEIEFEVDEELYSSREKKLALYLDELSDKCKELITKFYSGTSMNDLAKKFGYTNAANAAVQKSKCMEQLRKKFKKSWD